MKCFEATGICISAVAVVTRNKLEYYNKDPKSYLKSLNKLINNCTYVELLASYRRTNSRSEHLTYLINAKILS